MIPFFTTTITVMRMAVSDEPFEEPGEVIVVASGVHAVINSPSGREVALGGSQEVVQFRLSCDPVLLNHLDAIQDEQTGEVFEVSWVHQRPDLPPMEHTQAGLKQVSGASSAP